MVRTEKQKKKTLVKAPTQPGKTFLTAAQLSKKFEYAVQWCKSLLIPNKTHSRTKNHMRSLNKKVWNQHENHKRTKF